MGRTRSRVVCSAAALSFVTLIAARAEAALATDVIVSTDRSNANTSITSPAFSTGAANELLIAFVSTDAAASGVTVTGVTGAGLTWALVQRTNAQLGTSEIWRAFAPAVLSRTTVRASISQSVAASLTIVSFTGADASGSNGSAAIGATGTGNASRGAPTASLLTTRNNSWVFAVGNDFDTATARTVGTGQTMVHQYLASVGDTYWVQRQTAATAASGTTVTINDTAPTSDRYNLSLVEVLPAVTAGAFSLTGTVTPSTDGSGTTIQLSGAASASALADATGTYTFTNLANGTYTITPKKSGYVFTPASRQVTISGASQTVPAFTATWQGWSISGTISPTSAGSGALVTLAANGATLTTTSTDLAGTYTFSALQSGSYTVTPTKAGVSFSPGFQTVTINGASVPNVNFTANIVQTSTIAGSISPASAGAGAVVILSGTPSAYAVADGSGQFSFTNLPAASFTITPSRTGYLFSPTSQIVAAGSTVTFTATPLAPSATNPPDLSDMLPGGQISITGTGTSRVLQYTHDTFNGGTGPLIIQPFYNQATGTYQGTQYVYSFNGTQWTIAQQVPLAGVFVYDAAHGHFHFPFAGYGLYTVNPDGTVGQAVAVSSKMGFCIDDSFIYDQWLPNAGALGNLGACTDPTSLRGLDIGAVDEYDQTDEGQSISLANVPDGTYWLRATVDPNNFFVESDKSNNETDVEIAISGNTVQVLQTVAPVLPPPPAASLTQPAGGAAAAGTITLAATTSAPAGVQFLVDGNPFGAIVTTQPYTIAWDTTTVPNGTHWLAAQGIDVQIGTSPTVQVRVSNGGVIDTTPPTVTITDPTAAETVSATTAISANAADDTGVASVQFFVDGASIGAPVTAPPFIVYWDTLTLADGPHTVTATATDTVGNIGNAASVTVTVDNSHPPLLIGKDVTVSVDGAGPMQTAAFSTAADGEFLVAFVAYDGPLTSPQTATVSGGGLPWTLLKRSNSQAGTSEIWAVMAPSALSNVRIAAQPSIGTTYHGSMTVIAFTNAAGPGVVGQASAASGAPDIYLPGVSAGDWVFAVGNDWDNAVARTPVSGQVLVHQRVDTNVGDTYWVQSTSAPASVSALVDIHDSAPTADRWNYAAVEIVAKRP